MAVVVEEFLGWVEGAPLNKRIDAVTALTRSYLHEELESRERRMVESALLLFLDDPSPKLRLMLAQTLAPHHEAPRHVVYGLLADLPAIAAPILQRSPLLNDSDLLIGLEKGGETREIAIAARHVLSERVIARLARSCSLEAALVLVRIHGRALGEGDCLALVDRHGSSAALRGELTDCGMTSIAVQRRLVRSVAEAMGDSPLVRHALSEKAFARVARDASEKAVMELAASCKGRDLETLVCGLEEAGELSASTLLRACINGYRDFVVVSLACLCDLPAAKVETLLTRGRESAVSALMKRADLPPVASAILSMAVAIWRETARYRIQLDPGTFSQAMLDALDSGDLDQVFSSAADRDVISHIRRIALDILREDARAYASFAREAAA